MKTKEFDYNYSSLKWELSDLKQMLIVLETKDSPLSIFHYKKSLYSKINQGYIYNIIKFLFKLQVKSRIKKKEKEIKEYSLKKT